MLTLISSYTNWLHTQWPAGTVEKLPKVAEDGSTNVPGIYVVGDLSGIPLLKFSLDTGTKAVRTIVADQNFTAQKSKDQSNGEVLDLVIIGAGVSGVAAAVEAKQHNLNFKLIEASTAFSTIVNFPKGKPIYTYPTDMEPAGKLKATKQIKEDLLDELNQQLRDYEVDIVQEKVDHIEKAGHLLKVNLNSKKTILAHRVIIAIGRSGNYRKLNVPGEDLNKVYNRLHDPKEYADQNVLVVGGGDSALEAAIALAENGAAVVLSYRKGEFSRPKPDNIERLQELDSADVATGKVHQVLASQVQEIRDDSITLKTAEKSIDFKNDAVFPLIGREAPLDFFRKSGITIHGEFNWWGWTSMALFVFSMVLLYLWKSQYIFAGFAFPGNAPQIFQALGENWRTMAADRSTLVGTLAVSMVSPSFYYTLTYTLCIGIFGYIRVRRRKTTYVKVQTTSLFLIQLFPLFLLPEIILPYLGYNGFFTDGIGQTIADNLFERYHASDIDPQIWAGSTGHSRAYWRAYGFILAWPLFIYNVFTDKPNFAWLAISVFQTFVFIPTLIYFWGKGAYCGWICSCGALAETMGDAQREKMPHGPFWNRLNMLGQVILWLALGLFALRVIGWITEAEAINSFFAVFVQAKLPKNSGIPLTFNPLSYKFAVDILLGGILGVGLYFWYSGRTWCRFACPLAALMHIYSRFSRFRIIAEKKKCISCNVCTSVCHQGIDIMNFANKGLHMEDPQCVRCSACVQSCPTGVLQFGQVDSSGAILSYDSLSASIVQSLEGPTLKPGQIEV